MPMNIPKILIAGPDESETGSRPESVRSEYPPFRPEDLARINSPALVIEAGFAPEPVPGSVGWVHGVDRTADRPRIVLPQHIGATGTASSPESASPATTESGSFKTAATELGEANPLAHRPQIVLPQDTGASGTALSPESALLGTPETGSHMSGYSGYEDAIPAGLRPRIVLPQDSGATRAALSPESAHPVTAETGSIMSANTGYGEVIPSKFADGMQYPYSPGLSTRTADYFTEDAATFDDGRSSLHVGDRTEQRVPPSPQMNTRRRRQAPPSGLTIGPRPDLGKMPSLHSMLGAGASPGRLERQADDPEPSGESESSSNARSFVPGQFGAGEGADAGLGQQPYAYTSQGGVDPSAELRPKASGRTSLNLRFRPSKLGMSSVRTGPTTPVVEKPQSPEMLSPGPLPDVREEPGRSPTPPEPLSDQELNQRLEHFSTIYPSQTPKVRTRTEQLFRGLLEEFPELSVEWESPRAAPSDATATAAPDAAQQAAPAQPRAAFVARNVRIQVNPSFATGEGIVPLYLADCQARLRRWEGAHQPDFKLIRQAFETIELVNHHKENGTITTAQKEAAYDEAAALLRRGIGIDDATWELAKADIKKMGAWDASDGLLHLLVTAGFAGLVGADLLPEGVKNFAKYPLTFISNTVLNAFSQIGLNAIEDVASGNHGVPVMAGNIAASPRLMDLSPTILNTIRDVRDTMQELQGDPDNRGELIKKLKALEKTLEKHQTDYKLKIASARTYLEKYRRTLPYRIAVAMPSTIAMLALAPQAPFMLPAAVGLAALHQAVIIGLARWDEVSKFDHVLLSNAVRGNYIKKDENGRVVMDENNRPAVDTDVIRAMWSHPVDKIQNEFALVYTERLAGYYRKLNKDFKALNNAGNSPARRQKYQERIDRRQSKIDSLQQDIIHFTEGLDAIRANRRGAQWSELNMNGVIAKMLMSPREHVRQLTNVRLKRPGEFLAELGDRIYGTATLRAVGLGIDDAARAGDAQAPVGQSLVQSGVLASAIVANPTAKYFKATRARLKFFRKTPPPAEGLVPRGSLYGRQYSTPGPFGPGVDLAIPGRDKPLRVDFTKTDAWAKHTNSFGYRISNRLVKTAANVAQNSGEIIATPVALRTASRRNRTVKELRAEIAQTLRSESTAEGQAEPRDDNEAMAIRQMVDTQLVKNAADADKVFGAVRRHINDVVELAGYRTGLRKVDLAFLPSSLDAEPVRAGEGSGGPALGINIPYPSTVDEPQVEHELPTVQEESGASADTMPASRPSQSRTPSMVERGFQKFQNAANVLFPIGESPEHSDDAETPREIQNTQDALSPAQLESRQEPIITPMFDAGQLENLLDQISREAEEYAVGRANPLPAPGNDRATPDSGFGRPDVTA